MARPGFTTNPEDVVAVLLANGTWYDIAPGSFELGAWEVAQTASSGSGVEAARLGFRFAVGESGTKFIAGPISALSAVQVERADAGGR